MTKNQVWAAMFMVAGLLGFGTHGCLGIYGQQVENEQIRAAFYDGRADELKRDYRELIELQERLLKTRAEFGAQ